MPFNRVQHVGVIWVLLVDWMVPFSVKLNFCIQNITNNFYKHSKLCIIYLTKLILFTTGAWAAIRHVFPEVEVKGCVFHWSQSVWRHVQGLGLAPAYMEKRDVWEYIRKLLVLPFLPQNHVRPLFRQLAARADSEPLRQLTGYIENTWIESTTFPIHSWSIYGLHVRTNNDVEGYHNRLNASCGGRALSFYKLVPALRKQALEAEIDIDELVFNGVGRRERKVYRECDRKIFEAWDAYEQKELTTTGLLRTISHVYGPAEYTDWFVPWSEIMWTVWTVSLWAIQNWNVPFCGCVICVNICVFTFSAIFNAHWCLIYYNIIYIVTRENTLQHSFVFFVVNNN